jgi:hypothetical protein
VATGVTARRSGWQPGGRTTQAAVKLPDDGRETEPLHTVPPAGGCESQGVQVIRLTVWHFFVPLMRLPV